MTAFFLALVAFVPFRSEAKIVAQFRNGPECYRVARSDETLMVAVGREKQLKPLAIINRTDEHGYIKLFLADGKQLWVPPYTLDDRPILFRDKTQYGRQIARLIESNGENIELHDDPFFRSEAQDNEMNLLGDDLPPEFLAKPGALVIRRVTEQYPWKPTPVLHSKNGRYFTADIEDGYINEFGWEDLPGWRERLLDPLENPPFDRVLDLQLDHNDKIKSFRTYKVLSVVEPRLPIQQVWYWAVTTTGEVVTITGDARSAVGVRPHESVKEALIRMKREAPDCKWIKDALSGKIKEDSSQLEKTLNIEKLMNSRRVRFSRIVPKDLCTDFLVQSHDPFFSE